MMLEPDPEFARRLEIKRPSMKTGQNEDHTVGRILTVEILGEENSRVRGHRTAPGRIFEVIASAVDASVFSPWVADHRLRSRAGWTQWSTLQRQAGYETGTVVFLQTEPATALMKKIGRSFHRNDGIKASFESILGRI